MNDQDHVGRTARGCASPITKARTPWQRNPKEKAVEAVWMAKRSPCSPPPDRPMAAPSRKPQRYLHASGLVIDPEMARLLAKAGHTTAKVWIT
jgi:hypothetical protein